MLSSQNSLFLFLISSILLISLLHFSCKNELKKIFESQSDNCTRSRHFPQVPANYWRRRKLLLCNLGALENLNYESFRWEAKIRLSFFFRFLLLKLLGKTAIWSVQGEIIFCLKCSPKGGKTVGVLKKRKSQK